ncbi:NTP/NDP exchange transporter [Sandaracinus amylolyticus]|uniref:Transporter n=1 Tax=Sandaracinus amylolyticus TaxID=927083 RepID=A0A0F6YN82_9BACT|nr:hypothetical protein [Sandaracinus amylolyticus]AKF11041.1 transporter [Sandaracinus amylolyticus]
MHRDTDSTRASERRGSSLSARLLAPFASVRADEAPTVLLMAAQAFVLLTVYYLLKPVRESWILPGGAELKTYAAAVQAIALVGVAKGYDVLARRVRRDRLVAIATTIAIVCLVSFHAASRAGLDVGLAFYLWLGAFQLLLIAQFWSFASDLYTPEQGRRLFAVLGAGAAIGSVCGAQIARVVMRVVDTPSTLLLAAAALLLAVPVLTSIAHRRHAPARRARDAAAPALVAVPEPVDRGVVARVLGDPYLRLVALFTVLLNAIATLGEYALDRSLLDAAAVAVAHHESPSVEQYVGAFKADYYSAINAVVLVLQLFAVSRVLTAYGERAALAIMPVFVVLGAIVTLGASMVLPMLVVLATTRVVENGLMHSVQSTARQTLFLVATRDGRWSGKAFIDTVTWRAGDVLGAIAVATLAWCDAGTSAVIALVGVLGVTWLLVVAALGREHRARVALARG